MTLTIEGVAQTVANHCVWCPGWLQSGYIACVNCEHKESADTWNDLCAKRRGK